MNQTDTLTAEVNRIALASGLNPWDAARLLWDANETPFTAAASESAITAPALPVYQARNSRSFMPVPSVTARERLLTPLVTAIDSVLNHVPDPPPLNSWGYPFEIEPCKAMPNECVFELVKPPPPPRPKPGRLFIEAPVPLSELRPVVFPPEQLGPLARAMRSGVPAAPVVLYELKPEGRKPEPIKVENKAPDGPAFPAGITIVRKQRPPWR